MTMTDLRFKAQKYMNRVYALTTKGLDGKRKIGDLDESRGKKKRDHSPSQKSEKVSSSLLKKMVNFTPLDMPMEKLLL